MTKLTAAQIVLLREVLRNGGEVYVGMGRAKPGWVNKKAVERLIHAGILRTDSTIYIGPCPVDLEVTALGCNALRAAEMAESEIFALPTHKRGDELPKSKPVADIDFVAPECR